MLAFEIFITAQVASLLLGFVLPLLVGVVTKLKAARSVKAMSLLALSIIAGLVTTSIGSDGDAVISSTAIISALIAWATGTASYYGLWKPTGVANAVATKTENFGIGKSQP